MAYTVDENLQARILEWVDVPFSRGSSQSRDGTQVPGIAGIFFTAEPPGKLCPPPPQGDHEANTLK